MAKEDLPQNSDLLSDNQSPLAADAVDNGDGASGGHAASGNRREALSSHEGTALANKAAELVHLLSGMRNLFSL